jgi:hypothetical protein
MKEVRMTPHVALLHECYNCGWKRYITDTADWRAKKIDHPQYGPVSQMEAANLDVADHDCREHLLSVERLRNVQQEKAIPARDGMENEE